MARPRGKTGPNIRPLKVRFASKKFKKLVDQRVSHSQPNEVSRPVIVKPEEDPERKEAMSALKKSLEEFEKLHRKICSICYGDRLEGGMSGNSQPDESSCPGEEASDTETERDNETAKDEKEELASGSDKGSDNNPSCLQQKSRKKTDMKCNECFPNYQCQKFLTPGPPLEPKPKKSKKSASDSGKRMPERPKTPSGEKRKYVPPAKGADTPIYVKSSRVCKKSKTIEKDLGYRKDPEANKTNGEDLEDCKDRKVNKAIDEDSKNNKGTKWASERSCTSPQEITKLKETHEIGVIPKSTESQYKRKLNEMKYAREKDCKKESEDEYHQRQSYLCRLLYFCFRFVLSCPQKFRMEKQSCPSPSSAST